MELKEDAILNIDLCQIWETGGKTDREIIVDIVHQG